MVEPVRATVPWIIRIRSAGTVIGVTFLCAPSRSQRDEPAEALTDAFDKARILIAHATHGKGDFRVDFNAGARVQRARGALSSLLRNGLQLRQ